MDTEQLEILRMWLNRTPKKRANDIANDLGITTKELKQKVKNYTKQLIEYYEIKEGLNG